MAKDTKNEMVPTGDVNSLLDIFSDSGFTGYENLDNSDFKLTRLKIVQSTSEEAGLDNVKIGEIYNSTLKTSSPSLKITIDGISKARVMWPDGKFKRGDSPICRSGDGKVGHFIPNNKPNSPRPEGGEYPCDKCPFSKWGMEGGERTKPDCNLSYSLLLMLDDDKTPARMNFGGTSYSVLKDFINQLMQKANKIGKNLPSYAFSVILSTKKESNEKGIYYVADLKFNPDTFFNHPVKGKIEGIKGMNELIESRNYADDINNMFGDMMTSVTAVDEETRFMASESSVEKADTSEEGSLF